MHLHPPHPSRTAMQTLGPEWQQWMALNLARGCSVASMLEQMVQAPMAPELARAALQEAQLALAARSAVPTQPQSTAMPHRGPTGVRFAHPGATIQTQDRAVRIGFRLESPVVALLDDLLSPQECEQLMAASRSKLAQSQVVDPLTGAQSTIAERSSEGTFFARNEDAFIQTLDQRIATVMNWPVENGEGLQILRYQPGGEYRAHHDYFDPTLPGSATHLARGGQRVSTLVIYLNTVADGGETTFPSLGLQVSPKQGAALYFEYCDAQGQLDARTLHAGAPVRAGEKWIATKWMRQAPYH